MYKFNMKVNQNGLDAEIDEFGELTAIDIENERVKFGFRKGLSPKVMDRNKYDKTGIAQVGTTYPNSYDREELIELSKKPTNIYKRFWIACIVTIFVILIDCSCYLLMLAKKEANETIYLVAVGIAIAIDLLPIFIAHNLHRLEISRKKILRFFNRFCIIFILVFFSVVLIYRIINCTNGSSTNQIHQINEINNNKLYSDILESIFYMLIPIATSLLCFIINYLSYNPIESKIGAKRREILFKQEDVNELKALIEEIESKGNYEDFLIEKDKQMYDAANDMVDSIGEYYKAYVRTEIIKQLYSPADTTQLSTF